MWENDLAREFKKRDNKSLIGACSGTVISVSPFVATICDGQYIIDESNGYICNQLLERKSKWVIGTTKQTEDITLKEVVQVGDEVLVIPSADEQSFFIVDILKGVI